MEEINGRGAIGPKIHHLATQQQHESIKQAKGVGSGGMDGGANGDTRGGECLDIGHDLIAGKRVQAT